MFNKNAGSIMIILTLPFQFNIITDSYNIIKVEITKEWKSTRELTYYENYFAEKITYYAGIVTSIFLIFIYYKIHKMRIVISLGFFFNGITWLIYLATNENRVFIFIIIRGLQGIFLSIFQMSHCIYLMHFAQSDITFFIGNLIVTAMYIGLLFLNILFYCCNWRTVVVICSIQSFVFCGLIWLVPEIYIKARSQTNIRIYDKNNRYSLIVMIFLMILQQLSGIGILLGHLSQILKGVGLSLDQHLQSCVFSFVCFLSTFVSAFISDFVGIRVMWSISAFGLCIGLAVYGVTLKIKLKESVATIGIFIYFLFYALGEGPIPWHLCGTLFPEELRIESAAINVCENFFFFPILQIIWSNLDKDTGQFGSIVFSFVVCFLAIFCGFMIPNIERSNYENINVL